MEIIVNSEIRIDHNFFTINLNLAEANKNGMQLRLIGFTENGFIISKFVSFVGVRSV